MRVVSHGAFNLCPSETCNPEDGAGSQCEVPGEQDRQAGRVPSLSGRARCRRGSGQIADGRRRVGCRRHRVPGSPGWPRWCSTTSTQIPTCERRSRKPSASIRSSVSSIFWSTRSAASARLSSAAKRGGAAVSLFFAGFTQILDAALAPSSTVVDPFSIWMVVGIQVEHSYLDAGPDAARIELLEQRPIAFEDAGDRPRGSSGYSGPEPEPARPARRRTVSCGCHFRGDTLHPHPGARSASSEVCRDRMLQPFGLFMDLVPLHLRTSPSAYAR